MGRLPAPPGRLTTRAGGGTPLPAGGRPRGVDGGEIARSIAVQAEAAGITPTVAMNPVLLKPEGERRSQIIVEGRPWDERRLAYPINGHRKGRASTA